MTARPLIRTAVAILPLLLVPQPALAQDDETECVRAAPLIETWEWAYRDLDGTERFLEVLWEHLATTPFGKQNLTSYGYQERKDGAEVAHGREFRYAFESRYPGALLLWDRWEPDKNQVWEESYGPPLFTRFPDWAESGQEACPYDSWTVDTVRARRIAPQPGVPTPPAERVNETWSVSIHPWEQITTEAGTFRALPMWAYRWAPGWLVKVWYAPEAKNYVRIEDGPSVSPFAQGVFGNEPPLHRWDLTWYTLDSRPTPIFRIDPEHPKVGQPLTLDATPSYDREGPIVGYRWVVEGHPHEGPVVTVNVTRSGALQVLLWVTDSGNRTSFLARSVPIIPDVDDQVVVHGPAYAVPGQVVTLQALTAFEPVRVRWRLNETVIGDGPTYAFRFLENVTLGVDAIHPRGRTLTTNHTVTLWTGADGQGPNGTGPEGTGIDPGPRTPQFLDPLEGQIVPSRIDARVQVPTEATLRVDGDQVWRGEGPEAIVPLRLGAGRHRLELVASEGTVTVNVTVAQADGPQDRTDGRQIPLPGLVLLLAPALLRRSPRIRESHKL